MILELRKKSQITIPKDIVVKLGLAEGDKLEVFEENGMIYMSPVSVYPKRYIQEFKKQINIEKEKIESGQKPSFEGIEKIIEQLQMSEEDIQNGRVEDGFESLEKIKAKYGI